jgi:hypothetical protein
MKAFNLPEALRGAKVITREGKEVINLRVVDPYAMHPEFTLRGIIEDAGYMWTLEGKFSPDTESNLDLFMSD